MAAKEGDSSGRLRDFLLQQRRDGSLPLLVLVVALAASELRTKLDFDGEPRLRVQDGVVSMDVMEVKSSTKGAPAAVMHVCIPTSPSLPCLFLHTPGPLLRCAMRACLRCAGVSEARQQLQVAGRVLVWLLHTANPKLLDATQGSQLQLCGVISVGQPLTAEERGQLQESLDASCPGLHATMRLELKDH